MDEQNNINKAYDSRKPNDDKQEQVKNILKKELNFKNKKQRLLEEQKLKEAKAKDNAKYDNSKKYRLSSAPKYQRNSVIKQKINQDKQILDKDNKEQAAQATDSTIADFNKRKSDGLIENDYEEVENRALNTSFDNEDKNIELQIKNNNDDIKKFDKAFNKSNTILDNNINNKSNSNKVNSSNNINKAPLELNPLLLGKYIDNKILISNKYTKLGLSARSLYSNKNVFSKKLTKDINKSSSIPPLKINFNNHINNINNNISSIKAKTKPNSPIKNKPNNIISIKSNHNNNFSSHRDSLNLNQKSNNFNNNRNVKYYSNNNKSILDYSILDSRELNTSYYNDSNEIINYEEIYNVLGKNENDDKVNDIQCNTNKDAKINNEDINNRKSSTQAFLHGMNFNKNMVNNNNNDSVNPPQSKKSNKSLRSKSLMSRKSFKSFNNKNYNENYILTTNQAKQKREDKKEVENVIKNSEVNNDNDNNDIENNEMKILSNKQASFYEKERTRSIIKQKALDKVKETQQIKEDINNTNFRMNSHSKFIIETKYKGITKPFYMLLSNKTRTLKSLKEAFIKQDEEKRKRNNSNIHININNNNFYNIGTYDSTIEKNNNTNNNNTEFFTKREKNNNDTNKNLMNNLNIQNNQNNEEGEYTEEDFWESNSNNDKPKFSEAKFFEWRMQNENWLVQRNIKRNLKKEALQSKEESNLVGMFKPNINNKKSNNRNSYNEKSSNNISNNSTYSNNGFGNRLYSYASYYNSNKKQLEKKYYSNMFKPSLNSKSLNIYFPEDDSTRDMCDNSNYNNDVDSSYCSNSEFNKNNGKNIKQIKGNNTYKQYSRLSKPTTYQIEDNYDSNVNNSVNSVNKSPLKKSKTGNSQLIKNQIPERLSKYDNSQDNKDNKLFSYNNYNHFNNTNRTNTEQTNINNLNNYNNTLLTNNNSGISNSIFIKNAPQYTTPFKIVNNNSTGNVNIFVLGSKKLK